MIEAQYTAGYEFGPREEAALAKLANRTVAWGIVSLVISVVLFLGFVGGTALGLGAGKFSAVWFVATLAAAGPVLIVNGIVAILYIGAGRSLRSVITTQHDDVAHALNALSRLSGAFRVELIVSSIGIAGGVALLVQTLTGVI